MRRFFFSTRPVASLALVGLALMAFPSLAQIRVAATASQGQSYSPTGEAAPPAEGDWVAIREGIASWYGKKFHGKRTASGEIFDQNAMTAAHRWLPFGTMIRVTNRQSGESVIVRVNDRGPFIKGRIVDLSMAAAARIGVLRNGLSPALLEVPGSMRESVNQLQRRAEAGSPGSVPPQGSVPCSCSQLAGNPPSRNGLTEPKRGGVPSQQRSVSVPDEGGLPPSVPLLASAPKDDTLFVQIGAYSNPALAQQQEGTIRHLAPTRIDPVRTPEGQNLHRVRLGPLLSRKEALDVQKLLADIGYRDSRIVPF